MSTKQGKFHRANPLMQLALASAMGITAGGAAAAEFSYNGDTGPNYWHEEDGNEACAGLDTDEEGYPATQSPISIDKAKVDPSLSLDLSGIYGTTISSTAYPLHNGGHNIQLDYVPGSTANFNGTDYDLIQFHFHTYSEHQFGGEHAKLEMHAVMDGGDDHLVISQVFEVGKQDNKSFNPFLQKLINIPLPAKEGDENGGGEEISLLDGLVKPGSFYTYQGSLTTPPCTENVTWVVLKNAAKMTEAQYQEFRQIMGNNFRPAQELNGRTVYQSPGRGR